jgi:hypothetical protein
VYDGKWWNDDMHGRGVHRYADGRTYTGQFRYGTMQGHGKYEYGDGSSFEGTFVADLIDGRGAYLSATRERFDVEWHGVEPTLAVFLVDGMRPPNAPPTDGRWPCLTCTFDNQPDATQCEMCDAPKPADDVLALFGTRQESLAPDAFGAGSGADEVAPPPPPPEIAADMSRQPSTRELRRVGSSRRHFVRQQSPEDASNQLGLTREESLEFTAACVVCIASRRTIALVPCGHMCLCEDCLPLQARMRWCPMCRADFTAGLKVAVPPLTAAEASNPGQQGRCRNCTTALRTHAAMPCGHLVLCGGCTNADAVRRKCPECAANVTSWHQIFMLPTGSSGAGSAVAPAAGTVTL